ALLNDRPAPNAIVVEANDLPDRFIRQAGPMLAELESRIAGLAARFGVPHRERSRYRWVRAVLSLSIDNLEDTRAGALHPYGGVNPGLAEALDPGLKDLKDRLRALLALLESGGEPQS
ncbi:MAG TPA: hypothetical protein VI383_11085, partial [Gemmatimonadales bacterium]|nr:hypothetical protein [Gemmatimonadales bacterium]